MSDLALPIILIGGGGHASVLADILLSQGRKIFAVISPDDTNQRQIFRNIPRFKEDKDALSFKPDDVLLVNGIGMMPESNLRQSVNQYFESLGYRFETVIADSAIVSSFSVIEEGVQILPCAIVNAGACIGKHTIVNSGALVEHDCDVGAHNHIAPKAVLCGQVKTEEGVFVGANATIIQNLQISHSSVIGAGATVTQSVNSKTIVFGARGTTNKY
ncbi:MULTISPECIES: acetyltransferase [Vibrio]|uniref:Shikimate dehydrogenase n=1 Tax=Vibrio diazotrophicus TaxID=685 RepID=A0A329E943_VIBDI|nr:acetyltransferase [Vibrio diazotrophicus]PNH94255.1 shikimate dehydrogenase [Vibrio diazotrophicus]PNI00135.1 shikimate dehydrogenase [Vibrio diazotrophicus]RAS61478.1 sugar O-acyltransferase (sialic acid O-acetyltransferase NeuD family) [Vibrio diazotrophicus]